MIVCSLNWLAFCYLYHTGFTGLTYGRTHEGISPIVRVEPRFPKSQIPNNKTDKLLK